MGDQRGAGYEPGGEAEIIACFFHNTYERLAPEFGYKTREASAVPWVDVPVANKSLMVAVVQELLDSCVIDPGIATVYEGTE